MNKEELFNVFRKNAAEEFSAIPTDEGNIPYEFSDTFRQQMSDLIERNEKRHIRLKRNTVFWRAAIAICVVFFFVAARLILSALQISPNEQINDAETTEYQWQMQETKNKVDSPEDHAATGIQKRYKLTKLPEGFQEVRVNDISTKITTMYQNSEGNRIVFTQEIRIDSQSINEKEISDENTNPGRGIDLSIFDNYATAKWTDNHYSFTLSLFGKYDEETVFGLIESVH